MLNQVINTTNTAKKTKIPDSPFAKKWQQIEKKQKRNANTKKKVDTLYQTFQERVLPEEEEFVELLAKETSHLITFLSRKSFTQWQREELSVWIESNIDALMEHPFGNRELFEAVSKEYREALLEQTTKINEDHEFSPEEIEQMRMMAEDIFEGKKDFTDEEIESFMRDPATFQQALEAFMQEQAEAEAKQGGFFDDEADDEFEQDYRQGQQESDERHQDEQQVKKQNKLKSLFNSSNLNKLYKLLANRLHPDKEKNEHLKAEKSELMAKLVTAKKQKDAFTIISMFHQFMPESENSLFDGNDEELTEALVTLLNEKLHQLDKENADEKYNNGVKSMIWQKFNARSKKATEENIFMHIAALEDGRTRLKYYIHEVKTVKLLQSILSERYEERRSHVFDNPFENGDFSLDDLKDLFC